MKQVVVVLFLSGALAWAAETLRLESSLDAMGSVYSVVIYSDDRERMEAGVEEAFEEVRRLDRMLSNYRPESEWSRVNRFAAERPVKVPAELFDLLAACLEYSRRSEGAFDITVGPLMKVWGFYKGKGRLPEASEVRGALERVGYRNLILDRAEATVRFARPGVEIDPGGIGKGYTVDRMAAVLRERGLTTALISAGGSSIYAMGRPPGNDPVEGDGWKVDIRDPRDETQVAAQVVLKNESMSTSGSYEKFFRAGGRLYTHIMDPRTGYPASGVDSVSVIAPRAFDSEAWTKPFFIQGREWSARNRPAGFRVFLCASPNTGQAQQEPTCAWLK